MPPASPTRSDSASVSAPPRTSPPPLPSPPFATGFTINGFPYGSFHGTRVKEQVYAPDWSTPERLVYTKLLFDLIAELVPAGVGGSVSTVPGSFKDWTANDPARRAEIFTNMTAIGRYIADLSDRTGRDLHLGLEPERIYLHSGTREGAKVLGFTGRKTIEVHELPEELQVLEPH